MRANGEQELADIRLLGPLEAWSDGRRLPLGGRQQRALLALLLLSANRPVSVERLIDEIWGEDPPENARHSLEVYASRLRKILRCEQPRELLIRAEGGYRVDLLPGELDLERFQWLLGAGRRKLDAGRPRQASKLLRQALSLWRGEPLSDLAGERFAETATRQFNELYVACLEARIEADLALGHHEELAPELSVLVEDHPSRERLWAQLMLALYRAGRQAEALQRYRQAREELVEHHGIEPGPDLRELQARILRHDRALAPPRPPSPPRSNLPIGLGKLIDRAHELAELRSLIEHDDARLVTITGPPGVGKTRLALALAQQLCADVLDAVCFVGLAPLRDASLVPSAIAQTLEIAEEAGESIEQTLKQKLAEQELLLVLDNFEHVLPAAPLVSELLAQSPGLKVLVTSRAALHLHDERVRLLRPLGRPSADDGLSAKIATRYGAVRLFATRAQAVNPTFELTDANALAVAEICARLDGLPLAIELAAARTNLLSPEMLHERLGRSLSLLSDDRGESSNGRPTLRGTIQWSYELLDGPRQALFRRLGVFAGGWTLPAAEAVCDFGGDLDGAVPESLGSLIQRGLVQHAGERAGELRFSMLETLREYALEQLAENGEEHAASSHAGYFVALGARAEGEFDGAENAAWIGKLHADFDNLRAALRWSLTQDRRTLESAIRLAAGAWMVWGSPTQSELRDWLERAIARARQLKSAHVGVGLHGLALVALRQSDLREARACLEESLSLLGGRGSRSLRASALTHHGYVLLLLGERERALQVSEEALVEARRLRKDSLIATSTSVLGSNFALAGDYPRARALCAEAVAVRRKLGARLRLVNALSNLGCVAILEDDYAEASAALEEALSLADEREMRDSVVLIQGNLALVALFSGEHALAHTRLRQTMVLAREIGQKLCVIEALRGYAALAVSEGQHERGAVLWGAAVGLTAHVGGDPSPATDKIRKQFLEPALAGADPASFTSIAEKGQEMTLEEAVEYALVASGSDGG